jgi:hypothetical protein
MTHGQLLIVTADDFGLHHDINEAVERAHCQGILNAASLMVSAPAAADAVERAPATRAARRPASGAGRWRCHAAVRSDPGSG